MKEEKTENLEENSTIDYVQQIEKAYTSLLEQIEELKVQENYSKGTAELKPRRFIPWIQISTAQK